MIRVYEHLRFYTPMMRANPALKFAPTGFLR